MPWPHYLRVRRGGALLLAKVLIYSAEKAYNERIRAGPLAVAVRVPCDKHGNLSEGWRTDMVQRDEATNISSIDAKFRVKIIAKELADSDATMIRALEDLMIVLLNKKVIGPNEIHPVVVEKIKHRRKLREEMKSLRDRLDGAVNQEFPQNSRKPGMSAR